MIEALGWFLILSTVGGCNLQQAAVLGIAIATISPRSQRRKTKQCHPYRVRISPRWNQILLDFRLIGDDGEWVAIQETLKPKSSAEHFALRDGIQFTVLKQSAEFEGMVRVYPNVYPRYKRFMHLQEEQPGLIFSRSVPSFRAYSQFEETLDPIRFFDGVNESAHSVEAWIDASNAIDSPGYLSVNLFMDYCSSGYSLGISVSAYWWERVKNRCAVPLSVQHVGHYVRLVLAIISKDEFNYYSSLTAVDAAGRYSSDAAIRFERKLNENRRELGWEADRERDARIVLSHKYFVVAHNRLTLPTEA